MIDIILRGRVGIMGWRDATKWNTASSNQSSSQKRVHRIQQIIQRGINPLGFTPSNIITEEIYD